MDEDRFVDLETRLAHQERMAEDLNAALLAQWSEIERLRRELARLKGELEKIETPPADDRPPPHW